MGVDQWNGVAIASRVGLTDIEIGFDGHARVGRAARARGPRDRRHRAAACGSGRSTSPTAAQLGDPHLVYKLDWLARLRDAAAGWLDDGPVRRRSR